MISPEAPMLATRTIERIGLTFLVAALLGAAACSSSRVQATSESVKATANRDVAVATDKTDEMVREARAKARTLGEEIGGSVDDAVAYAKIKAKLAEDRQTSAMEIQVDVADEVVTLRGHVQTAAAKRAAGEIATTTVGVRQVHNLLTVRA
jgi:hyperosmotically inducible periplasmic protein